MEITGLLFLFFLIKWFFTYVAPKVVCPKCHSRNVETSHGFDRFPYQGEMLEAEIPFRTCKDCGFEYTDFEAEEERSSAILAYRKKHKL